MTTSNVDVRINQLPHIANWNIRRGDSLPVTVGLTYEGQVCSLEGATILLAVTKSGAVVIPSRTIAPAGASFELGVEKEDTTTWVGSYQYEVEVTFPDEHEQLPGKRKTVLAGTIYATADAARGV